MNERRGMTSRVNHSLLLHHCDARRQVGELAKRERETFRPPLALLRGQGNAKHLSHMFTAIITQGMIILPLYVYFKSHQL